MRRSPHFRKRILIDTGAFYTFADESDAHHTDATSFVVMGWLKLSHAITFDRNFTQYGVTVLTSATV